MTLPILKDKCIKKYEALAAPLRREFNEPEIEQIYKVIKDLPSVNVEIKVRGAFKDDNEIERLIEQPSNRSRWIQIHANEEYTLVVNLQRLGAKTTDYIYCRFPKPKNEGWFLNLGHQENGELLALKRVPFKSNRTSQHLIFTSPPSGRVIYTLYFISDCFIGLDQQFNMQFEIIEERKTKNEFMGFQNELKKK